MWHEVVFLAVGSVLLLAACIQCETAVLAAANLPESEIQALYELYNSTHGEDWAWKDIETYGAHWEFDSTANPCEDSWQGVTCLLLPPYISYTLWQLDLQDYNLKGRISDSIGNFPYLVILSLGNNYLTGTIPEGITSLSQLDTLELSNNKLNGTLPSSIGNLAVLENLILTGNQLNGSFPDSMQAMTRLAYLGLANNHFNGTIPGFVGNLPELVYCELNNNFFTGSIPPTFASLHKLNNLDIYRNQLTGHLPALDALTELRYMQVNNNHLSGTIPSGIGRLLQLRELDLQYNNFSGSIPPSIGNLVHLERVSLQYNKLNGSIPASMGNLTAVYSLTMSYNQLTGSLPAALGIMRALTTVDLQSNHLNGPIPSSIGNWTLLNELQLSHNDFTGPLPETIGDLTSLTELSITYTSVSGQIPESIGYLTNLYELELFTNRLSGTLPSSLGNMVSLSNLVMSENRIEGPIPASLGQLPVLRALNIHSNLLDGPLPPELGDLATLIELALSDNRLTGSIPPSYENLQSLLVLGVAINQLDGPLPAFLPSLPTLKAILLHENRFTGTIPEEYGSCASLQALVLSGNPLHGPIPAALGDLTSLRDLSLVVNFLTGTIPPELGQLTQLSTLDLGYNQLQSSIPASLGNLAAMNFMGLSNNLLTGTLPEEMGALSSLSYLSLFNNRITGSIPSSFSALTQLQSLQVQSNALSGSLEQVFDPSVQFFLNTIQLSSNAFTGQIPPEVFLLPSLQSFVAVSNCFDGTLPETICSAWGMQTLDLDALHSAAACRTKLFHTPYSTYINKDAVHGSVPACAFQLPQLQTLHLSSNALVGSLPGDLTVTSTLVDLSLSYNKLTGSIPHAIQERAWLNLDLSYNRLTGTLSPHFAHQQPGSIALSLEFNRLSGVLPAAIIDAQNVSALQSNIFSCDPTHSDLPEHDPYVDIYQCGSDTTDTPYYAWLTCLVLASIALALVVFFRERLDRWLGVTAKLDLLRKWLMYTEHIAATASTTTPTTDEIGVGAQSSNLVHAFLVCQSLCSVGLRCAAYAVLVLAPAYIILTRFCGTHSYQYIWSVSIILLQGDIALAVEFVLLFGMAVLFLYLCAVYLRPTAQAAPQAPTSTQLRVISTPLAEKSCVDAEEERAEAPSTSEDQTTATQEIPQESEHSDAVAFHSWKMPAAYVLINFTVVGIVNIYYVFLKLNATPTLQLTISAFKVVWNGLVSPMLSRHFLRPRTEHTTLELFVTLVNTIAIPILAVVFVSPDCFYNAFVRDRDISVSYVAHVCSLELTPGQCIEDAEVSAVVSFPPPFVYNFQCSYVFSEFYVPAFIYVCLFSTFGLPLMETMMVYLHARAVPGTRWFAFIDRVTPRILKPVAEIASFTQQSVLRPYFDATQFVITQLTFLALLMTFGAVFPPLAFALGVTMVSTIVLARVKVGRFLHNALVARLSGYENVIAAECAGIGGLSMLRRSVWMILNLSAIFYGLFMFDTIGTTTGFNGSFWVLIVVPVMPTIIFGVYSLCVKYVPDKWASELCLSMLGRGDTRGFNAQHETEYSKRLSEGENARTMSALHISPL